MSYISVFPCCGTINSATILVQVIDHCGLYCISISNTQKEDCQEPDQSAGIADQNQNRALSSWNVWTTQRARSANRQWRFCESFCIWEQEKSQACHRYQCYEISTAPDVFEDPVSWWTGLRRLGYEFARLPTPGHEME